jgi:hypothetical protein
MRLTRWLLAAAVFIALAGTTRAQAPGLTALLLPNLFGPETPSTPPASLGAWFLNLPVGPVILQADYRADAPGEGIRTAEAVTATSGDAEESEAGTGECNACWLDELVKDGMSVCRSLLAQGRYDEANSLARMLTRVVPNDEAACALRCLAERMFDCCTDGRCTAAPGCAKGTAAGCATCPTERRAAATKAVAKDCKCEKDCGCCKADLACCDGPATAVAPICPGFGVVFGNLPPPPPLAMPLPFAPPPPPHANLIELPPAAVPPPPYAAEFLPMPVQMPIPPQEELRRLVEMRHAIGRHIEHLERMLVEAVSAPPPACSPVAAPGARPVHLVTPEFEAQCDRLNCAGSADRLVLEGDVRLLWKQGGRNLRIEAARVLINVKEGTFTVERAANATVRHEQFGTARPAVYQPVEQLHYVAPPMQYCPPTPQPARPASGARGN